MRKRYIFPIKNKEFVLGSSISNRVSPTREETTFNYELNSAANVNLSVFDLTVKRLLLLVDHRQMSCTYRALQLADDIANGISFNTEQ